MRKENSNFLRQTITKLVSLTLILSFLNLQPFSHEKQEQQYIDPRKRHEGTRAMLNSCVRRSAQIPLANHQRIIPTILPSARRGHNNQPGHRGGGQEGQGAQDTTK